MPVNINGARVVAGQRVAENQREQESKKPFTVAWKRTSATINQVVKIDGTANFVVKNPALITVGILFNGKPYAAAEKVVIVNNQISAEWTVKAVKAGHFKEGVYDAEIRYNSGVPGKTNEPLRIVDVVRGGDFFG